MERLMYGLLDRDVYIWNWFDGLESSECQEDRYLGGLKDATLNDRTRVGRVMIGIIDFLANVVAVQDVSSKGLKGKSDW
jgi:hypothetical protein